jgi:endonuclease-8
MPEGDTVFVWARTLETALRGKPLVYATSNRVPLAGLRGHAVSSARAHGKQLLVEFDDGRVLRTHYCPGCQVEPDAIGFGSRP